MIDDVDDDALIVAEAQPDEGSAKAAAEAALKDHNRGSRTVSLDLPGLWPVTAEQRVTLAGFRAEMNGPWIAKRVEITLSKQGGLRTRLDLEDPDATPKLKKAARNKGGVSEAGEVSGVDPEYKARQKEKMAEVTGA